MKNLFLLLVLLAFAAPAFAQNVTFDSAATGATDTEGTTPTVNLTVGSNSDRALLICVGLTGSSGASVVNSMSWNSGAQTGTLVKAQGTATSARSELWIIKNPDTGTHALTLSEDIDSGFFYFGVISLYNVHQTTSTADPLGETVTSGTSLSLTPTTVSGDMAVDCWASQFTISSATAGGGQTARVQFDSGGGTVAFAGSTEAATGASTAMTWTLAQDEAFYVALNHVAVAVKKVSSATPTAGSTLGRRRN